MLSDAYKCIPGQLSSSLLISWRLRSDAWRCFRVVDAISPPISRVDIFGITRVCEEQRRCWWCDDAQTSPWCERRSSEQAAGTPRDYSNQDPTTSTQEEFVDGRLHFDNAKQQEMPFLLHTDTTQSYQHNMTNSTTNVTRGWTKEGNGSTSSNRSIENARHHHMWEGGEGDAGDIYGWSSTDRNLS
jgi:hypothetical protein